MFHFVENCQKWLGLSNSHFAKKFDFKLWFQMGNNNDFIVHTKRKINTKEQKIYYQI